MTARAADWAKPFAMVAFGLSLMPEDDFAAASFPLFEAGLVETVEWSFDMGWGKRGVPGWLTELLNHYGSTDDLVGHGVSYSVLAAQTTPHHDWWLDQLEAEVRRHRYSRISEHLGFVGAGRFSFAAPLPVPFHPDVVALGRERITALAEIAGCPVGLENLATSLGPEDGRNQGALLDAVLEPVDGFLVLDLHNLWCQSVNLNIAVEELVDLYPLDRVAEIHVSGGSWDDSGDRRIRRDTHDDVVPPEVRGLLAEAAGQCPKLEAVIYERLGTTLADPSTHDPYRHDVMAIAEITGEL